MAIIGLTHWGRDQMAAISQTTLSIAFSWMKMLEFRLNFHWSLFLRVPLTIFQHWFRSWLGAVQATSHYLNQWWLHYRRIYVSLGLNELKNWLSPVCCLGITWIWPIGKHINEIWNNMRNVSFMKMYFKLSAAKYLPFRCKTNAF